MTRRARSSASSRMKKRARSLIRTDDAVIGQFDQWGRLAPQIAYYVSAYCDMVKSGAVEMGEKINICVPTGNSGNITAAYIAKRMGCRLNKRSAPQPQQCVDRLFKKAARMTRNRDFLHHNPPRQWIS